MTRKTYLAGLVGCVMACHSCNDSRPQVFQSDWSKVDTIVYDARHCSYLQREEAFDSVWMVKLETVKESLMGSPDIVLFADSTIIVADKTSAKAVFMFDHRGRYLGRLSRLGNGPGEFLMLGHVALDGCGNVCVYDEIRQTVMRFSQRGELLGQFDCGLWMNAFEYISPDRMAMDIGLRYPSTDRYGNTQFAVRDSMQHDRFVFGMTAFEDGFNFTRNRNLYSFGGKVYGNVNFDDVIYEFQDDGVQARYLIEIEPDNARDHFPFEGSAQLKELLSKYSHFTGHFVELLDYAYFGISTANPETEVPDMLFSHRTGQTHLLMDRFNNPMMAFFKHPIARYRDNCLVCCSGAVEVLSMYEEFCNQGVASQCPAGLTDGLDEESNPVLFFYRLAY